MLHFYSTIFRATLSGPGASDWFSLPYSKVDEFQKYVARKYHGYDILDKHGLWFATDTTLRDEFRVYHTVQEAGDVVSS